MAINANQFLPRVSIVIPVYNGANFLREAINSALAQTYSNIEVIVVNDGSDDGGETEKIALGYANKIRYFSKQNGGVGSALNVGIAEMTGEYFSWLSHDDMYGTDKIGKQIALLETLSDKTTVISCGVRYVGQDGRETGRYHAKDFYNARQLSRPLFPLFHGCINGCTLLIHRSHFTRVGVFNETLPYTQDYDLWFRIMREASMAFHPCFLSMTRIHERQGSRFFENDGYIEAGNRLWIAMMQSLTKEEIHNIAGSSQNFYWDVCRHLLRNSQYDEAASFSWEQACMALEEKCASGIITDGKRKCKTARMRKKREALLKDRQMRTSGTSKWKRAKNALYTDGLSAVLHRAYRSLQSQLANR
ncbi:glycosyltransferase [Ruminococcaceae bacterium OttesenSCG-928-L11]|nr:glycosyltransferase [Ruminococcaceae bacterium OttesenSCG-928-L11]